MTIHEKLLLLSKTHGMPEIFAEEDLALDKKNLEKYQGSEFIWLLRSCGTALIPIYKGANPVHVTHWVKAESRATHGQKIIAFHISSGGKIRQISDKKVLKLASEPPMRCFHDTLELHCKSVNRMLDNARNKPGSYAFGSPDIDVNDWGSWAKYFNRYHNQVMLDLMNKAIKHARSLNGYKAA